MGPVDAEGLEGLNALSPVDAEGLDHPVDAEGLEEGLTILTIPSP